MLGRESILHMMRIFNSKHWGSGSVIGDKQASEKKDEGQVDSCCVQREIGALLYDLQKVKIKI